MGYTHYWNHDAPIPSNAWDLIVKHSRLLFDASEIALSHPLPLDGVRPGPYFDRKEILFDGAGNEGYETFQLRRAAGRESCKTEHRPYDRLVCCVLALAVEHCPAVTVTSDGTTADWAPHLAWAEPMLRRPLPMPPLIKPAPT